MSLISRVHVISWDIPLFEEHFMGASIEAGNDVTLCQIHLEMLHFDTITSMPPGGSLLIWLIDTFAFVHVNSYYNGL